MKNKVPVMTLLFILTLSLNACKKEKKPIDPLSYLPLIDSIESNKKIEAHRTQLISIVNKENISILTFAFAMDSKIPETASKNNNNAYGIRFTIQDSLLRSKRLMGGTFVLKFKNIGDNRLIVRNFEKNPQGITRNPAYNVDAFDTIVNPEIVNIQDTKSGVCIVDGCKGSLEPIKPHVYEISISLKNIAGESWSIDHGYLDEDEDSHEPTKILNETATGIKLSFPNNGESIKNVLKLDALGNL